MLIYNVGMGVGIREIKNREIIEKHEEESGNGSPADKDAENEGETDKSKAPLIQEIGNRQDAWAQKEVEELRERLGPLKIAFGAPNRVENLGNSGVQKQPTHAKPQGKQGKFLHCIHDNNLD